MKILRFLRILTFIGASIIIGLVMWKNLSFIEIVHSARKMIGIEGKVYTCLFACFIAYPILFILTIIVLKLRGWRVYLIYGKGELSLFGLFVQNELRPFVRFLTDRYKVLPSSQRFPYSVDLGFNRHIILAFIYRCIRCMLILLLIAVTYVLLVNWLVNYWGNSIWKWLSIILDNYVRS